MAIALTAGHVNRALDFYRGEGKYFIIGGTVAWDDETSPPTPSVDDYKLIDIIGLKRVDNAYLVVPDENGTINYRTQNWRIVSDVVSTTIGGAGIVEGATTIPVESLAGLTVGGKVRINNQYEAFVTSVDNTQSQIVVDTPSPSPLLAGSPILGGAIVEGAKYVYLEAYLNYDEFPIATYRQIGLCTAVTPSSSSVLKAAAYSPTGVDEFTSIGSLEILDNRQPNSRDIDQRELLSLIIQF